MKTEIGIFFVMELSTQYASSTNEVCNTYWNWCAKVRKWWIFKCCEKVEFLFKNAQIDYVLTLKYCTFHLLTACERQWRHLLWILLGRIHLTTELWDPKILTQNFKFRKKCWKFVDQIKHAAFFKKFFSSWACLEPNFFHSLGRNFVQNSIQISNI